MVPHLGVDPLSAEGSYNTWVRGSPSSFTLDRFREGFLSFKVFPLRNFIITTNMYVSLPKYTFFCFKGLFQQ